MIIIKNWKRGVKNMIKQGDEYIEVIIKFKKQRYNDEATLNHVVDELVLVALNEGLDLLEVKLYDTGLIILETFGGKK